MAVLAVAAAGAAAGGALFGTATALSAGWLIGATVGPLLFGPRQKVEGPRLGDLTVQASTWGMGIPRPYGAVRLAGNVIWATDLIERRKKTSGGKGFGGPAQVSYEYFASFAVAFGEGPAAAIRRVWADGKLIVDLSPNSIGGRTFKYGAERTRFYVGTEDQLPDPLIEAHEGAGQVPAFRGLVYATFEELPLKDFGNRIPNITAEVVGSISAQNAVVTGIYASWGVTPSVHRLLEPSAPFVLSRSGSTFVRWNRLTNQVDWQIGHILADNDGLLATLDLIWGFSWSIYSTYPIVDPASGRFWLNLQSGGRTALVEFDETGNWTGRISYPGFGNWPLAIDGAIVRHPTNGRRYLIGLGIAGTSYLFQENLDLALAGTPADPVIGPFWQLIDQSAPMGDGRAIAHDPVNHRYWVQGDWTAGTLGGIAELTILGFGPIIDMAGDLGLAGTNPRGMAYDLATARLIVATDAALYRVDPESWTVEANLADPGGFGERIHGVNTIDGAANLFDGTTYRRVDTRNMTAAVEHTTVGAARLWWDELQHGIRGDSSTGFIDYLDRYTAGATTVGAVVQDLCEAAGLDPGDLDVAELSQSLSGYVRARPMSAREAIEPLARAFFFDAAEIDFKLAFRSRDRQPVATIPSDDLASQIEGETRPPRLAEPRQQESELPRVVSVTCLNALRDYEPATQQARRIQAAHASANRLDLELPIVLTDQQAKEIAAQILASAWVERHSLELFLPPRHIRLDPTDVVEIEQASGTLATTLRARLVETALGAGGVIRCRGVLQDAAAYAPNVVAVDTGESASEIIPFEPDSRLFLWNGPALGEDDDTGGFFLAAAPAWQAGPGAWRGAVVLRASEADGAYADYAASLTPLPWFRTLNALPDWTPDDPWMVFDRATFLDVRMQTGDELESASELEVLNGANLIVVGSEVLQFTTATLIGTGTYRLTGLLRGRFGTELHMRGHRRGEVGFVFTRSALQRVSGADEIGSLRFYKGVTIGTDPAEAAPQPFTNEGAALLPWAPCHIHGVRDGAANLTISWVRRTRYGGGLKDGTGTVPLHEEQEAYLLEVLDEEGQVVLTVDEITTPAHTLSEAEPQASIPDGIPVPLANPSFETGNLSGWTVESGSFAVASSIAAGITAAAHGSFFAYQSGLGNGAISQVVGVSEYHLESGDVVTLTTFAADWTSSNDTADLTLEAFDEDGLPVGAASTSTNPAVEDAWEPVSVSLELTGTPATIKLTLAAIHVSGGSQASIAFDGVALRVPYKVERSLAVRVYQISAGVGRGHPGSAIV